ncbi:MAG: hypothetical protein RBT46_09230, partial [Weeksellaceae bacterium]|nr:hypothetical protein [Weeksellaceae bacterium]
KNAETPDLIVEFTLSKQDGFYSIILKTEIQNILVEFSKLGYETQFFQFKRSELGTEFQLDVVMQESTIELEEVTIRTAPKIQVKEDTVSYKASAFLDGSERKVEDLLKKLPGIQVEEDGRIKFKGKPVEKVLLEGDDLFDYNYTIGTKNMNVDIVDQVQAIENYTENPLLRGIQDSEKVALNLKLKKNLIDFSGDAVFDYGIENRHFMDLNTLTVTRTMKNFSTVNYNNIGENYSPFDYFSFRPSVEDTKNGRLKTGKLINERIFLSGIDNRRANSNDNWFTNFNNIYKISNRLSARINFSYYKDELDFWSSDYSDYSFEDGVNLTIAQEEKIRKRPEQYDGNLKLIWNSSKTSLLEFYSKWSNENIITDSELLVNNQNELFTRLKSESFFTRHEIVFTQKLNSQNVFQIKALFSRNDIPQDFFLSPGLDFLTEEISSIFSNRQISHLSKNHWELNSVLLGARKSNKFQISAMARYTQNRLDSELFQNENPMQGDFLNQLNFNLLETNFEGFYNFRINSLSIKPTIRLKNYVWERVNSFHNSSEKNSRWVIAPELRLNYKINDVMRFFANYSYDENPPAVNHLFMGYVLTSNRSLVRNLPVDKFKKTHSAVLGYEINDMYNQFIFNVNLTYSEQKNNFFTRTYVTENLTFSEYFFLPEGSRDYSINMNVEKYIPPLQTTFKLSGSYSVSEYKNIVNNSDLRDNKLNFNLINLYGKTAFNFLINFQNELKIRRTNSHSNDSSNKFNNTSLVNSFKILVKPDKNWFGSVSFDYFQPSTQNPNEYYFLDMLLRYRTPNKIWEFTLSGKNLTNNKFFEEIYVSDYYNSTSLQSLNKSYILVGMSFSF